MDASGVVQVFFNDWEFRSFHTTIINSKALEELGQSIERNIASTSNKIQKSSDNINIEGHIMHLPPAIYDNDILQLIVTKGDSSTFRLTFDCTDAFMTWARQHTSSYRQAFPWNPIQVPYSGSWKTRAMTSNLPMPEQRMSWDWTYTIDYCGTILTTSSSGDNNRYPISVRDISSSCPFLVPCESSGVDLNMLRDTSQPILFFDERILYHV